MVRLTAVESILIGGIAPFLGSGEAFILAHPLAGCFVKESQTFGLVIVVGTETDCQWCIQLCEGVALAVKKSDVDTCACQFLLIA